jgi:hypothetical protein
MITTTSISHVAELRASRHNLAPIRVNASSIVPRRSAASTQRNSAEGDLCRQKCVSRQKCVATRSSAQRRRPSRTKNDEKHEERQEKELAALSSFAAHSPTSTPYSWQFVRNAPWFNSPFLLLQSSGPIRKKWKLANFPHGQVGQLGQLGRLPCPRQETLPIPSCSTAPTCASRHLKHLGRSIQSLAPLARRPTALNRPRRFPPFVQFVPFVVSLASHPSVIRISGIHHPFPPHNPSATAHKLAKPGPNPCAFPRRSRQITYAFSMRGRCAGPPFS